MKHLGWKITFALSWIPGLFLYYTFTSCLIAMGGEGLEPLAGGLGFVILLIPTILFLGLQTLFAYLAFRH